MKYRKEDYSEPDKIDHNRVKTYGDIESHASFLMNMRLGDLFKMADETGFAAGENPDFRLLSSYHSILNRIYLAIYMILPEEKSKEIQGLFIKFINKYATVIKDPDKFGPLNKYYLLMTLDNIQAKINAYLQEKRYFFRDSSNKYNKLAGALQYFEDRKKELGIKDEDLEVKPEDSNNEETSGEQ